jgi:hypothetical protein
MYVYMRTTEVSLGETTYGKIELPEVSKHILETHSMIQISQGNKSTINDMCVIQDYLNNYSPLLPTVHPPLRAD